MVRAAKTRRAAGDLRRRRSTTCTCATSTSASSTRNAASMPPLRGPRDRDALRAGARRRHDRRVCSDHTPVDEDGKQLPFAEAEPGATGLELLLPLTLKWAAEEQASRCPRRWRASPRRRRAILGVDAGHLAVGAAGRRLHLRSGSALARRADSAARARARTRRSSGSKCPAACATRWSAGRSCTKLTSSPIGCDRMQRRISRRDRIRSDERLDGHSGCCE